MQLGTHPLPIRLDALGPTVTVGREYPRTAGPLATGCDVRGVDAEHLQPLRRLPQLHHGARVRVPSPTLRKQTQPALQTAQVEPATPHGREHSSRFVFDRRIVRGVPLVGLADGQLTKWSRTEATALEDRLLGTGNGDQSPQLGEDHLPQRATRSVLDLARKRDRSFVGVGAQDDGCLHLAVDGELRPAGAQLRADDDAVGALLEDGAVTVPRCQPKRLESVQRIRRIDQARLAGVGVQQRARPGVVELANRSGLRIQADRQAVETYGGNPRRRVGAVVGARRRQDATELHRRTD